MGPWPGGPISSVNQLRHKQHWCLTDITITFSAAMKKTKKAEYGCISSVITALLIVCGLKVCVPVCKRCTFPKFLSRATTFVTSCVISWRTRPLKMLVNSLRKEFAEHPQILFLKS